MSTEIEGNTIGERIRNLRQSRNVSQHDICIKVLGRLRSSQSWFARIEMGEGRISAEDLKRIATHLLVSVDDLIP